MKSLFSEEELDEISVKHHRLPDPSHVQDYIELSILRLLLEVLQQDPNPSTYTLQTISTIQNLLNKRPF
jgi:hypothetical protein